MNITLTRLTDDALIASLRALSAKSHEIEADIIEHLIEVEDRRLHLDRAYPSLFAFCTAGLGFQDGAAYNRIEVARAARRLPAMLASLRSGDVHLTGLRLLAPHLTEENHPLVLQRAKRKTKQEIAELVAELAPKTPVSDSIRKLPEKKAADRREQIVPQGPKPVSVPAPLPPQLELRAPPPREVPPEVSMPPSPSSPPAPPTPSPRTYAVQFTAREALKDKLREAQDLLRHQVPAGDIATIVERALELLIDTTKKKRFGIGAKPRQSTTRAPDRPSRHVPAEVRRRVFERDGGRCAYVDADGHRCEETAGLELDHLEGFARTGVHDPDKMRLTCRAHNQHAADKLYGRAFMSHARTRRRGGPTSPADIRTPTSRTGARSGTSTSMSKTTPDS